jgi:RNA 3'-phosphate cyclase
MLEIDGSQKSGSGTILRLAVALCAIKKEPLHICNIRYNRKQPGLRPQHLESVLTAAKLCNAKIKGAALGSHELWFTPNSIITGEVNAKIETAGSIPMLLLTVLPICSQAKGEIRVHVQNGGTDVRFAPTANYMKHILLPILEKMNFKASLNVSRYGYYPKGNGEATLTTKCCSQLKPLVIEDFGTIEKIEGISVCTFLEKQKVAERQAKAATDILENHGYTTDIRVINDRSNPVQKGSSIVLWAKTSTGAVLGGDAIGERGKSSERVGKEAAENLLKETNAKATVDVHLADMLIPYIALAKGSSSFIVRKITEHIETNIWLTEKILGTKIDVAKVEDGFRIQRI